MGQATHNQNVVLGGTFCSQHVLINFEREQLSLAPMKRCRRLDQMARKHAEQMARIQALVPSTKTLDEPTRQFGGCAQAGENVCRAWSVWDTHCSSMLFDQHYARNILSKNFTEFGVGTAKANDGMIYIAQHFRGDGTDIKESMSGTI
jgi:uncharacterized protein YkwD